MRKEFIKTGKCIWCGRGKPEVTFYEKPHVLPRSLGSTEIGFDICDECNHTFGKAKMGMPSMDLTFKEIFNAYRFFGQNLNENSYKNFKSVFFTYRHKEQKIVISKFFDPEKITRVFKRSLFYIFLQRYHHITGQGNRPMFDSIRKYVRYGVGGLHVFYAFNNVILSPDDKHDLYLPMTNNQIDDIMEYGVFPFWLLGHTFYLEVFPLAFNVKGVTYLQKEAQNTLIPAYGDERILEVTDIRQTDFLMTRFNR